MSQWISPLTFLLQKNLKKKSCNMTIQNKNKYLMWN